MAETRIGWQVRPSRVGREPLHGAWAAASLLRTTLDDLTCHPLLVFHKLLSF